MTTVLASEAWAGAANAALPAQWTVTHLSGTGSDLQTGSATAKMTTGSTSSNTERIYLGGMTAAVDEELLTSFNITGQTSCFLHIILNSTGVTATGNNAYTSQGYGMLVTVSSTAASSTIRLTKTAASTITNPNTAVTTTITAGTTYNVRFQRVGSTLRYKIWTGASEPGAWSVTASDAGTVLGSGAPAVVWQTGTAVAHVATIGAVTVYDNSSAGTGTASFTAASTLSGTPTPTPAETAGFTASATLAATGTPTLSGFSDTAAFTTTATLAATPSPTPAQTAGFSAGATLSATRTPTPAQTAPFTVSATLASTATATSTAAAAAPLTGTASLTATGTLGLNLPYTETFPGAASDPWPVPWTTAAVSGAGSAVQSGSATGQLITGATSYATESATLPLASHTDIEVVTTFAFATQAESYLNIALDTGTSASVNNLAFPSDGYSVLISLNATPSFAGSQLMKTVGASTSSMAAVVGVTLNAGVTYSIRLQRVGTTIRYRIWLGNPEPSTWDASVTDSGTMLPSGDAAVYWQGGAAAAACTATIGAFQVDSAPALALSDTATFTSAATLAATATPASAVSGTFSASATLTSTASPAPAVSAGFTTAATLSASPAAAPATSAAFTAAATLSASPTAAPAASAGFTAAATLAATPTPKPATTAGLTAAASLAATKTITTTTSAGLTALAALAATSTVATTVTAPFSPTATLTGTPTPKPATTAGLTAAAALAATRTIAASGTAAFAPVASLTSTPAVASSGTSAFTTAATLDCTASVAVTLPFFEGFDSGGSNWPPVWTPRVVAGATGGQAINMGGYGRLIPPTSVGWGYQQQEVRLNSEPFENFDIQFDVTMSAQDEAYLAVSAASDDLEATENYFLPQNGYTLSVNMYAPGEYGSPTNGSLELDKTVADTKTVLQVETFVPDGYAAGTPYTVRFFRSGDVIRAKIWETSTAEPSTWLVDVVDSGATPPPGQLHFRAGNGADNSTFDWDFDNITVAPMVSLPYTETFTGTDSHPWPSVWTSSTWVAGGYTEIQGNAGRIVAPLDPAAEYGAVVAMLSMPDIADTDVAGTFVAARDDVEQYLLITINGSGGVGFLDDSFTSSYYLCPQWLYDGTNSNLTIYEKTDADNSEAVVASTANRTFTAGTKYGFRFQRVAQVLQGRVWDASTTEPTGWDVSYTIPGAPKTGAVALAAQGGAASTGGDFTFDDIVVAEVAASGVAAFTVTANLAGTPTPKPTQTAGFTPTVTLAGTPNPRFSLGGLFSPTATLTVTATPKPTAVAAFSPTVTLGSTRTVTLSTSAGLTASGTLAATSTPKTVAAATFTVDSTLTASTAASSSKAAGLTATAGLSATLAGLNVTATAAFSPAATLGSAATPTVSGAAPLSPEATLNANVSAAFAGVAAFTAVALLAASRIPRVEATTSTFAASATLSAAIGLGLPAPLTPTVNLSAGAVPALAVRALLSVLVHLTATKTSTQEPLSDAFVSAAHLRIVQVVVGRASDVDVGQRAVTVGADTTGII